MPNDDRDRRRVKTPPAGVRAQTAQPLSERADLEVTPRNIATISPEELRAMDAEEAPRRTREARDASVQTLDVVDAVRTELKGDIARVERKVDEHGQVLGDLRESTGQISGQIPLILDMLEEQRADRRDRSTMTVTAFAAEVDVGKAKGLADVEVRKTGQLATIEVKKHAWLKVIAVVGPFVGAAIAGLIANC